MPGTRNPGRVARFWYLLLVLIGPLRLIYIPNKLFVPGDATSTVNNISAHLLLFRLGIVPIWPARWSLSFSRWPSIGSSREWTRPSR